MMPRPRGRGVELPARRRGRAGPAPGAVHAPDTGACFVHVAIDPDQPPAPGGGEHIYVSLWPRPPDAAASSATAGIGGATIGMPPASSRFAGPADGDDADADADAWQFDGPTPSQLATVVHCSKKRQKMNAMHRQRREHSREQVIARPRQSSTKK